MAGAVIVAELVGVAGAEVVFVLVADGDESGALAVSTGALQPILVDPAKIGVGFRRQTLVPIDAGHHVVIGPADFGLVVVNLDTDGAKRRVAVETRGRA